MQLAAPAKTMNVGTLAVTDFQGRDTITTKVTAPASEVGTTVKAATFDDAVAAARKIKSAVDPGVRAVIDAGDGVMNLRPINMDADALNLFSSRSYGSAKLTDAAEGVLGIFDWRVAVPAE